MRRLILIGCVICALEISGCVSSGEQLRLCAESGETIRLQLHDKMNSQIKGNGGNLSVSVAKFEDKRQPSKHLGSHICRLAGDSYFDLTNADLSQAISDAFVNYLKKSDFQVSTESNRAVDIDITGRVIKFSTKATRHLFYTKAQVDMILEFTIANKSDKSTVHIIVRAGSTNDVTFFGREDMEELVSEVLQNNFKKFLDRTKVKGKTLRQKI